MIRLSSARAGVPLLLLTVLLTSILVGCDDPPPSGPPIFEEMEASYKPGLFWHDLRLVQRGLHRLRSVDLTITVYTERDKLTLDRHWGSWRSGEAKIVDVSASGGSIQRIVLSGTAQSGVAEQPVRINTSIYWEHEAEE